MKKLSIIRRNLQRNTNKEFFYAEKVKERKEKGSYTPLDVVKILLRERAMKQSELAQDIGISRQALNNYLRGHWSTPTQIKIKVAQALKVDSSVIWDFLGRNG